MPVQFNFYVSCGYEYFRMHQLFRFHLKSRNDSSKTIARRLKQNTTKLTSLPPIKMKCHHVWNKAYILNDNMKSMIPNVEIHTFINNSNNLSHQYCVRSIIHSIWTRAVLCLGWNYNGAGNGNWKRSHHAHGST